LDFGVHRDPKVGVHRHRDCCLHSWVVVLTCSSDKRKV
jgi:hypothetical protein